MDKGQLTFEANSKVINRSFEPNSAVMTMQEIAESLGVSYDTVNRCVKRVFPDKLKHGKRAYFNEAEISCISRELKNNTSVLSHQSVEVSTTVKNTTTDLEVIGNAISAFTALQKLYDRKEAEYKATIAEQEKMLEEQRPKVEVYDRIAGSSGLKSLQETAAILGIGSNVLFATLRGMNVLYRSNGNNIPMRKYLERGYFEVKEEPYKRGGKDYLYSRTFVTEKGLLWLEKIVRQGA